MTKIEELREQLEQKVNDAEDDNSFDFAIWDIVDSLISAAREEVVHGGDVFVGQVINGAMFVPNNKPDGYYWVVPKKETP